MVAVFSSDAENYRVFEVCGSYWLLSYRPGLKTKDWLISQSQECNHSGNRPKCILSENDKDWALSK